MNMLLHGVVHDFFVILKFCNDVFLFSIRVYVRTFFFGVWASLSENSTMRSRQKGPGVVCSPGKIISTHDSSDTIIF